MPDQLKEISTLWLKLQRLVKILPAAWSLKKTFQGSLYTQTNLLLKRRTLLQSFQILPLPFNCKYQINLRQLRIINLSILQSLMRNLRISFWKISVLFCWGSSRAISILSMNLLTNASMNISHNWINRENSPSTIQRRMKFGKRWAVSVRIKRNVFRVYKENKICQNSRLLFSSSTLLKRKLW